jgi:dienelactone hydrolase
MSLLKPLRVAPLLVLSLAAPAVAAIKHESLTYQHGGQTFRGDLVYDDAVAGRRPGVLVVHEWMGLVPLTRQKAEAVAKLGYVALAADMYGDGRTAKDAKEAGQWATALRQDRALMRARAQAGLEALKAHPRVDGAKLAAMGYCFGGGVALELARSGAPLRGTVSFHGNLDTPNPADARNIKGQVLALHGADDPFVPPAEVSAFQAEMRSAKVDWQMNSYGGAVHSFTNPAAGNDPSKGAAYNEKADRRSWEALTDFLRRIF